MARKAGKDPSGRTRIEETARRARLLRDAVSALEGRALTQQEFAARAGIRQSSWAQYERAHRLPSIDNAQALVDTYDITLDWLYLGKDHNMPFQLNAALKAAAKRS